MSKSDIHIYFRNGKTSMYYKPGAKNKCLHKCLCFSLTGWHQNTVLLQQRPLDLERWLRALSDFVESSGLNSSKTNMVAHKLCNFSFRDLTFSAVLPRQWTDRYVQVNVHMNKIKINKSLKYQDYIWWCLLLFEKMRHFIRIHSIICFKLIKPVDVQRKQNKSFQC